MKRFLSLLLCFSLALSLLAGCSSSDEVPETAAATEVVEATRPIIPAVRVLLFQPELAEGWEALASAYTSETGVPVTVVVSDSKNWEQTLHRQLEEEDAPTLFQMLSPTGTGDWASHCYDLTKTDAAKALVSKSYALVSGEKILALPDGVNAWGIWVNLTLLEKTPFALEDITSQAGLKTVVDAIWDAEAALPFSAFAPLPEDAEEAFMPLAAAAVALEYQRDGLKSAEKFRGTELPGLCSLLALMAQADSQAFSEGKALFCLGSAADWAQFSGSFAAEDLALIPAFLDETTVDLPEGETEPTEATEAAEEPEATEETEAPEEPEPQGLLMGAEHYWCVNADAPAQDLPVTLDFLNWLLGTEEGAAALAALGCDLPYTTARPGENPFLPEFDEKDLLHRRDWAMPSYQWRTSLFEALAACLEEPSPANRDAASKVFSGYWAAEYALTAPSADAEESKD